MEAHPQRTRWLGLRFALLQLALLPVLALSGYVPLGAAALCAATYVYSLWSMRSVSWPLQRPPVALRVVLGLVVPLLAHATLAAQYGQSQQLWLAHAHDLTTHRAPWLPHAHPHQVVALLSGVVWSLPLFQWVSETTQEWSLPAQT